MHAFLEPLRNPIDLAWLYLFHASWQSAIAGTVVLALVLVGKRRPAPLRYALLTVVLLKFVAPPFLAAPSGVFSRWGPAVASSQMTPLSVATDDMTGTAVAPRTTDNSTSIRSQPVGNSVAESQSPGDLVRLPEVHVRKDLRDVGPRSSATAKNVTLIPSQISISPVVVGPSAVASGLRDGRFVALLAWLIGAALATAWLLDQQLRLSRILRGAQPITDESIRRRFNELATTLRLKRPPRLLRSDSATVPFACGLIVRTVVVPGELIDQLLADQLDVVLAHELAHHRRHDLVVNAVQTLTFVAFWFHPVYWWLTRNSASSRAVLRRLAPGNAPDIARHLLRYPIDRCVPARHSSNRPRGDLDGTSARVAAPAVARRVAKANLSTVRQRMDSDGCRRTPDLARITTGHADGAAGRRRPRSNGSTNPLDAC